MKFIDGVNRILRKQGILRGDDDAITSFSGYQHSGTIQVAKIAIQDEADYLAANKLLTHSSARTDGTLTVIEGTSIYALATDFLMFTENKPYLYEIDISTNRETGYMVPMHPGGVEALRKQDPTHRNSDRKGIAISFFHYSESGHNFIRLYPRSDATRQYRFWYVTTNTTPETETDELPFTMEMQARLFITVAARRFDIMFKSGPKEVSDILDSDPILLGARANLLQTLRIRDKNHYRGRRYAG